jgi:Fe-S cluster biogenesis protein NfuA/nitrite reductase/ring-hydroxylating ferredoxin subunit
MEFDQAVAQLETLVATLERDGDERALELLRLMDAIHRPALELLLAGTPDHPIAAAVLAMYELVPLDEHTQIEEALDEVRPYIESHGGALDLLDVEGGIVHVRMSGSCHGCAASAMTLRRGVETKLRERIPWFEEIVAHEPEDAAEDDRPGVLPLLQIDPSPQSPVRGDLLQIAQLKRPVFVDVGALADVPPGEMTVAHVDDKEILVINVDGDPYAFHNICPVDGRSPLDGGRLTGSVLVCPWHNCAYDARSGKRADDEPGQPSLAVVPIALSDGVLRVAANVA